MPSPTEKFNMLYDEFLKWKNSGPDRGNWFTRKALFYRKNRDLLSRRSRRRQKYIKNVQILLRII